MNLIPPGCPVPEEYVSKYDAYLDEVESALARSCLSNLACVLIQTMHAADAASDRFRQDDIGRFTGAMLLKLLNEGWALVGCLERAAYLAAHHHARACIELRAGYHWAVYRPGKRDKRIGRFYAFDEVRLYQMALRGIQPEAFDDLPSRLAAWEAREPEWKVLFGVDDIEHVRNWHHGATIENMVSELPDGTFSTTVYAVLCNAVHFSPLTQKLTGGGGTLSLPVGPDGSLERLDTLISTCTYSVATLVRLAEETLGIRLGVKLAPIVIGSETFSP